MMLQIATITVAKCHKKWPLNRMIAVVSVTLKQGSFQGLEGWRQAERRQG